MGNKGSKQKQSASLPIPPPLSTLPPDQSPKTPTPTFTLPSDLASSQHARCLTFLKDFQVHRQTLTEVSSQLDRLHEELETAKKSLGLREEAGKLSGAKAFCLLEGQGSVGRGSWGKGSRESSRRQSGVSGRGLGKHRRSGQGGGLSAEVWMAMEADAVHRSNVLTRMSIFSTPSPDSYDLETLKLIFSTLLHEKSSSDQFSQSQGLRPRSFPDFLIQLLLRLGEQQSEGLHHIARLLGSIRKLHSHPVAALAEKMFHLTNKEPASYQLGVMLPRLYEGLKEVGERRYREKAGRTGEYHMELDDKVRLADVLDLLYRDFAQDPLAGSHLLLLLKPSTTSQEDFHQFCLTHKLHSTGLSLESIIETLTGHERSLVSIETLARGLKRQLNLWLTEYDLKSLIGRYDHDGDGEVDKMDLQPMSGKAFPALQAMDPFAVSALDYLVAVEEVARERTTRMVKDLLRLFGGKEAIWSIAETAERLRRVARGENQAEIDRICEELRKGGEEASVSEVLEVVVKFPIGEWEASPLVCKGLLALQEDTSVEDLLLETGNILEELGEED